MIKDHSDQTPEGRIAAVVLRVMRGIQSRYPLQDLLQGLRHASHGDLEDGIRTAVQRELDIARQEALSLPFNMQAAKRIEIATRLAQPYD